MTNVRTPRVRREERRARLNASLDRALEKHGLSMREAAARLGVDEKNVRRWCDVNEALSITTTDLAGLTLPVIADVVADVAPGHVLVELPKVERAQGDMQALAEAMRETGEAITAAAAALDACKLTKAAKVKAARREVHEALVALLRVDLGLEAEERAVDREPAPLRAVPKAGAA